MNHPSGIHRIASSTVKKSSELRELTPGRHLLIQPLDKESHLRLRLS